MKAVKFNGYITSIRARRDRSLGFSGETPELSREEKVIFMDLQGVNLDITLEPLDEVADGLIEVETEAGLKSQAQRLRSVMFVKWKQDGEKEDFRDYYHKEMEKMINFYKEQLE